MIYRKCTVVTPMNQVIWLEAVLIYCPVKIPPRETHQQFPPSVPIYSNIYPSFPPEWFL